MRPLYCSIYDPDFWRHERFWKVPAAAYLQVFNGTPFKSVVWRCSVSGSAAGSSTTAAALTEKTLVTHRRRLHAQRGQRHPVPLAGGRRLQVRPHQRSVPACTLGVGAFVHYGVTIGDGAVLAPDSFLMKGEEVPPHAHWGGNPAREMRDRPGHPPARRSEDNRRPLGQRQVAPCQR